MLLARPPEAARAASPRREAMSSMTRGQGFRESHEVCECLHFPNQGILIPFFLIPLPGSDRASAAYGSSLYTSETFKSQCIH
jgi:hypothetical protein